MGRRVGMLVVVLAALTIAAPPAQPPGPVPPPDPAEAGRLLGRVSALAAHVDDLAARQGERQEEANRALADDTAAATEAGSARVGAEQARAAADEANENAEGARRRVDAWIGAQYQQADTGTALPLLAGATGPAEVLDRAQLLDAVSTEQAGELDAFERARAAAADADTAARARRDAAADAAARAGSARSAAVAELDRVRAGAVAARRDLDAARGERDAARARLRVMEAADPSLAAGQRRADDARASAERAGAAQDADARTAAVARLAAVRTTSAGPSGSGAGPSGAGPSGAGPAGAAARAPTAVRTVLDRALSVLGTDYAWGGGDADGATLGIRDGGVADSYGDFAKTGFDCSGLITYAFAGIGKELPHYSGYQETAGQRVPIAQRRPGDLLFWADDAGAGAVHHVALYLGGDRMVEAPQSGETVRVAPVRFDDELVPTVTRLL